MAYIQQSIYSGAMLEIQRKHVSEFGRRGPRQSCACLTGAAQQEKNRRRAQQRLMRLMCANFTRGDFHITLTFSHLLPAEQRKKEWGKFIRRLRAICKKRCGRELKYICVLETGCQRPHYHLVCESFPFDVAAELQNLWNFGTCGFEPLDGCPDYGWMARYLLKQDEKDKNKKRWFQSRNLTEPYTPEPKILKRKSLERAPRVPKGYYVLSHYRQSAGGYDWEYIIAIRYDRRQELPEEIRGKLDLSDTWKLWADAADETI